MIFEELLSMCEKIFQDINVPVALTDSKLEIQWANDESLKRFPSMSFKNAILENLNEIDLDKMMELLRQGKTFSTEGIQHPMDASHMVAFPVIDGELVGCLFMVNVKKDNSDLVNIDMQEKILSSFSDSYKMPLTIIFSTLGLMARNIDENDNMTKTYIKLISQNCYRLYRLSNNINDEVRFRAGMGSLKMMNGDLTAFLTGLCEAARIMTAAIGIPLKMEMPDRKVLAAFDSGKLATVILNLISNSCKFTREGNKIVVRLELTNENAVITVMDSGEGIKDDLIKHIFESHFSYNPDGMPITGNGMGLFIVKNIVSMHGGTIAVRSRAGEGTKVAFTLPVKLDESAQDYTAESGMDYLSDRFSAIYVELSDICGSPIP